MLVAEAKRESENGAVIEFSCRSRAYGKEDQALREHPLLVDIGAELMMSMRAMSRKEPSL